MNVNASNMSSHETQAQLQQRLKEVLEQRESTEANVKSNQHDLEKMVGKKTKRPRETIAEIDEEIAKLELERTINSMSLAEERAILKQIHKLMQTRRQVSELAAHDQQVQAKKTTVSTLRGNLKDQREEITELKQELAAVNTAVTLGCDVKDLVCTKIACPAEKMGAVIGKKGKNVQTLKSTTKVDVDIVRNNNVIHLTGTTASLDQAVTNLDKVISQTEETIDLSKPMHNYLTSARIATLSEWRERHAAVYIGVSRLSSNDDNGTSATSSSTQMRLRGTTADIAAVKLEVQSLTMTEQVLQLSSRDAGLLVGKAGATIASLVQKHQASIDVQRPPKKDEADNAATMIPVTVTGPFIHVQAAVTDIENMVEANKDHDGSITLTPTTKSVLLLNSGVGLQDLRRNVNEAVKNANETATGSVLITLLDTVLGVKGKAKALEIALELVNEEISRIESMVVKIKVDPFVIPVLIGKGGQGIKDLKEGTKAVYLDVDRETSQLTVGGLDQVEVNTVATAVKAFLAEHHVQRLRLESDDMGTTNSFATVSRSLLRSAVFKEAKELVFLLLDDASKELVLRGKPDDVAKSVALVNEFLAQNFVEELVVSTEDLSALLSGGKKSKIVELAAASSVNLSADRDRNAIIAKGEKNKVVESMKLVREFLYGSADVAVSRVEAASAEVLGVVIGKGGKTLADLQAKFAVSIIIHRADAVLTLRGERDKVAQCRVEVLKLILSASVVKSVELSPAQLSSMEKAKMDRKIAQSLPVQVTVSNEKSCISFRGSSSDVQMAVSLLNEHLNGVYESRMQLGSMAYQKVEDACRNPTHLDRIQKQSSAKISFDTQSKEIVLSGSRGNVKVAKEALMTLLDFLLGGNLSRCDVPDVAIPMIGKPAILAEISASTDALLTMDRDLNAILVVASDADKVTEAGRLVEAKLAEIEALVFVWKFVADEDWLVSAIIGKSGETVKKLRKQTGCTIEVITKDRRVILYAADSMVVAGGKSVLDDFVEKARNGRCVVPVSEADMPAFVGRGGVNIKKFSQTHNVEVQTPKKPGNVLHIIGNAENVAVAKLAVESWIAGRVESLKDAQGEETKFLIAKHIPVVIGTKGATIRGLEREFGCKVDIDRAKSQVTVKGGTPAKRIALLEKMDTIIAEDAEKPKDEQSETDSTKENHIEPLAPVIEPVKPVAKAAEPEPTSSAQMVPTDFPTLSTNGSTTKGTKPLSDTVWSTKSKDNVATPFIGDVDEANEAASVLEQMD